MKGGVTFILGGARSGKSTAAERMARRGDRVLFVATAEALDEEMDGRIRDHRRSRPTAWDTVEEPRELVSVLQPRIPHYDVVLVDCITMWVSNLLLAMEGHNDAERCVADEAHRLLDLMQDSHASWILVSNEVGSGIVPASPLGRAFRDALGRVNQIIAARSDRVLLMVAGLAFEAPRSSG
ncbi:MAG: bifunctional adenosylcobinamide kinase/adenosylcobinamide-phosphate guanylyltransferase [bacterium]|nr:bifunctional adenosylcobinamide kinase/adenosylcobinamide-phosphate guanylyltransferase [bacterium]MDE0600704.1 bifunctional adenosylcobinamide kinase/adenosylcobinamide-phosphate guanylyltransferase [bacterium]